MQLPPQVVPIHCPGGPSPARPAGFKVLLDDFLLRTGWCQLVNQNFNSVPTSQPRHGAEGDIIIGSTVEDLKSSRSLNLGRLMEGRSQ